jgi:hypothetical protein
VLAFSEASVFVHGAMKLPWEVAELRILIKRGGPHALPLLIAIMALNGVVFAAVKAARLSRLSDPDAIVEIVFFANNYALYTGPWYPRVPPPPHTHTPPTLLPP